MGLRNIDSGILVYKFMATRSCKIYKNKYNNIQYKFIRIFLTSDKYTKQVR